MSEPLLTARYTALAQPEDGAGNDARRAKRVHRLENASPSRPSPAPPPSSYIKPTNTNDAKATLASRRKSSLRDSKGPLGPRPLDMSPSKRVTSDSSNLYSPNSVRPTLPNATSEPFLGLSGRRNTASNFSFDSAMSTSGSHIGARKAFLRQAAESNDSSKITPVDTRFPSGNSRFDVRNRHSVFEGTSLSQNNFFEQSSPSVSLTPGASPTRARNPPIRATQIASGNSFNAPLSTNLAVRTRRQSQFPPAPVANPDARQPRKSLGPGVLTTNGRHKPLMDDSYQPRYTPSDDLTGEVSDRSSSGTQDKQQPTLPSFMAPTANTKRYIKTQSLQPGPRQTGRTSATQRLDSETNMPGRTKSPARPKVQRLSSTPTSTLAIQGGGLGARTISPTDARKLKRASRSREPPPVPQRSHTPEFSSALGPDPTSPIPRQKSATPSSSRATPDVGQRTSSARPLSSRSSYCSARSPSATAPIRPTVQTGALKSPNQKQRNVHSSAGGEDEIVPPVPAIPKAFESPKDQPEQPFFSNLKSGLDNVETASSDSSKTKLTGDKGMFHDANTGVAQGRHKRGFTTGSRTDAGQANASQHGSRQGSQQMRLPPLNLLPLGDPTSAKIASLYQQPRTGASGKSTPPPRRGSARTPTTPMTASKATFSQYEHHFPYDLSSFPPIRSSTSYDNADAKGSSTNNDSEDGSSGANVPESPAVADSRLSPFVSSSLPKANDGTKALRSESSNLKEDPRASRLIGRRSRAASKGPKDTSATPTTEVEQQPAPNSLRRRLSMGWRRSSSKASHQREGEPQTQTQSSDMPPPKIPASVLIQESLRFSPGLSSQTPKLPELEPRKRSIGSIAPEDKSSQPNIDGSGPNSSQKIPTPQPQQLQPSKSTSSLLSPVHKIINARSSSKNLPTQESKFDRDDVAAEEEMRKLAYKRKDFESTMKEMDDLKKRASPKDRISPGQAARMSSLNIYERGEIIDYTEVYFCGQKTAKKFVGDLAQQSSNFGFDDERGDYNIVMGDHLAFRYEVIDVLGKGSFGQVVRCIDHKTGKLVAIKIIRNKKRFHQQALVEVGILQKLREWDAQGTHSTINFTQSFYFRGHLCISTELLGMNLYEFIKAHEFRGFSLKLIRRFTKQMLGSLVLLQDHKVIHCDLKPENILLSHPLHSEIKTIDFGSSCFESEKVYTYIQSRFYRAPEVILGANYGMPIDMWSLGCILAELLTGYPIFPGENEQEQLACIMEVFGPPEKHLIEKSTRKKLFFDSMGKPRITVSSKGKRRRPSSKTLQQALKCDDDAFLDFLTKCLRWDPDKRMKPNEATKHEFVTGAKKLTKSRPSIAPSLVSSPAKRVAQSQTPSKARPLPEPPATSYKDGIPVRQDGLGAPSSSPIKSLGAGRRHSAMNNLQPTAGMKKVSQSAANNSALPRVTNRSASGKPDLASAAAIASIQARR